MWKPACVSMLFLSTCTAVLPAEPAHIVDEELSAVLQHKDFLYEQRELPLNLRRLMVGVSLARSYRGDEQAWYRICDAVIENIPLSDTIHHIDPTFIPHTTKLLEGLSARMDMQAPLVCIADEHDFTEAAAVCALGKGQYCLVLSRPFLAAHTLQECEAILLHELAHIKRKHLRRQEALSWLYPALLTTGAASIAWWQREQLGVVGKIAALFGCWSVVAWIGSDLIESWWGRRCEHDADRQALQFYSGTPEQYLTTLQKAKQYIVQLNSFFKTWYAERYAYVAQLISSLPTEVPRRYVADLQVRLAQQQNVYKQALLEPESSIFDEELTPQERITYLMAYLSKHKGKHNKNKK